MIVNNHYPSFFQWVVPMVNRYYFSDGHVEEDYVTEIVASRFTNNTSLVSVDAPLVESIATGTSSTGAFKGCSNLTSVSLPNAVSIGNYAFYGCESMESIVAPNVETFGQRVLNGCQSITSVNFPKLNTVGMYAFSGCISLTSVTLPMLTAVPTYTFNNCPALEFISLPSATSVGTYSFQSCTSLTSISLPKATSIGKGAFTRDSNLTHIYLDGYTSDATKPWDAINSASNPKYLRIGLTSISAGTSSEPSVPTTFKAETIELPNCTSIGDYAFGYSASGHTDNTHLKTVIAPVCETVGSYAFNYCVALESVNIPNATSMGIGIFIYCTSLVDVDISSATSLLSTFSYCAFTRLILPNVTTLGSPLSGGSVNNCTNLSVIDLHKSVNMNKGILAGTPPFNGDTNLYSLILRGDTLSVMGIASTLVGTPFATAGSGAKIYVPSALVDSYKTATNWSEYAEFFTPLEGSPYEDPDWWKD